MNIREAVKDKKRIVIKIGSSSLMHNETGRLNLGKIEKLVRTIVDIKNSGKDVVLVSSALLIHHLRIQLFTSLSLLSFFQYQLILRA